jgi:hypothetical protein
MGAEGTGFETFYMRACGCKPMGAEGTGFETFYMRACGCYTVMHAGDNSPIPVVLHVGGGWQGRYLVPQSSYLLTYACSNLLSAVVTCRTHAMQQISACWRLAWAATWCVDAASGRNGHVCSAH